MKKIVIACVLIAHMYAFETNSTSSEHNRTWSTAITGAWSSVQSELTLYNEYKLNQHVGLLAIPSINFHHIEGFKIHGYSLSLATIYYWNEDAYIYEGLYALIGGDINYFYPGLDLYVGYHFGAASVVGYGWHFFDHHLLIKLSMAVAYRYPSLWVFPFNYTIAYIF